MFDKKKEIADDGQEAPGAVLEVADAPSNAAKFPEELSLVLRQLNDETDIFTTRLASLQRAYSSQDSDAAKKRSLSHAKHAALCVRDALKNFGRIKL